MKDSYTLKTQADIDQAVADTLAWAAAEGITDLTEEQIRDNANLCRQLNVPYLRPFTVREMAERW